MLNDETISDARYLAVFVEWIIQRLDQQKDILNVNELVCITCQIGLKIIYGIEISGDESEVRKALMMMPFDIDLWAYFINYATNAHIHPQTSLLDDLITYQQIVVDRVHDLGTYLYSYYSPTTKLTYGDI